MSFTHHTLRHHCSNGRSSEDEKQSHAVQIYIFSPIRVRYRTNLTVSLEKGR